MSLQHAGSAMDADAFVRKWGREGKANRLNERSGAQAHFIDLCRVLGVSEPTDPDNYCFERSFKGVEGSNRFADVWKRGCFAWEYKAPGGNLRSALHQLMQYVLPLENPPLLVVSDRLRIEINTHFTGHPTKKIEISNKDLRDARTRDVLRNAFLEPYRLKPQQDSKELTAELASTFAAIAAGLRHRGEDSFKAAHFLTQCLFSFFADGAAILPGHVFKRLIKSPGTPADLQASLADLFGRMSIGGRFGVDVIPWFNGGLFRSVDVPLLESSEIDTLAKVADADWRAIDASIFGTLFERGLDPAKRSQFGMHYTDAATIERLLKPTIRHPLEIRWDATKRKISGLLSERDYLRVQAKGLPSKSPTLQVKFARLRTKANQSEAEAKAEFAGFLESLRNFRVLDPACGSGNFLYLALKALKDIELRANVDAEELGLHRQLPVTGPHNVLGIEVNEYAAELARATVWIGELQWLGANGIDPEKNPILKPLDHIECRDALLNRDGSEASWPIANVLIGNPPFLGVGRKRRDLGDEYFLTLDHVYGQRVPGAADLVCYWFEKARKHLAEGGLLVAGLVATNSIRGGRNRHVLEQINLTSRIFEAWGDEPWVNEGADVRVSFICFGAGQGTKLDGAEVSEIYADLTAPAGDGKSLDVSSAEPLRANAGTSFQGCSKKAKLEIEASLALQWLQLPNPNGRPNSDVVKPWANGFELSRRPQGQWIIDFGLSLSEEEAAQYEKPFEYVVAKVRPERLLNKRDCYRKYWWRFAEPRPGLRAAISHLPRFIATVAHSKHRFFVWLPTTTSPDQALILFARSDDTSFGLLHSRFHEVWALRAGTSIGVGNDPRYTPTTCFESFPFPPGLAPSDSSSEMTERLADGSCVPGGLHPDAARHSRAIAKTAKALNDTRERWINPPEWVSVARGPRPLGLKSSPYADSVTPLPEFEDVLKQRTMTKLYNLRPDWLRRLHLSLDMAVAHAYGWQDYDDSMPDDEILQRLIVLNEARAADQELPSPAQFG